MKEKEIRNPEILKQYIELVKKDVKDFFNFRRFVKVQCPACAGTKNKSEFSKDGFKYVSCDNCSTLFVNPRPDLEVLKRFYADSPSTKFWVEDFFKPFVDARREKIFRPRAEHIRDVFSDEKKMVIGDIGAGFGIFLDEFRKLVPDSRCIAIEPSKDMARLCREKGLEVQSVCMEDMKAMDHTFDLLTAFELIEHLFDPCDFLKRANALLKSNGHLFITTLNGKGFDTLLLWERSKSITPPHHLNFFNTDSIRQLLERCGFEIIEICTPGRIDWDIVEGAIKNDGINAGRLWEFIAQRSGLETKKELQEWISKNNLSSHMRVVARKK